MAKPKVDPRRMTYEQFKKNFPQGLTVEVVKEYFGGKVTMEEFEKFEPDWVPAKDAAERAFEDILPQIEASIAKLKREREPGVLDGKKR